MSEIEGQGQIAPLAGERLPVGDDDFIDGQIKRAAAAYSARNSSVRSTVRKAAPRS